MMKIDEAPAPLIVPNPDDPRLTERVTGTDQTGAAVKIRVPVERPLTLYLNAQQIVTMMTIGDYPEYLALGYLLNAVPCAQPEVCVRFFNFASKLVWCSVRTTTTCRSSSYSTSVTTSSYL